jgi:hypothetical protein
MDTIMTVTFLLSVALLCFGFFFYMMEGRFKKVGNVMTILSIVIAFGFLGYAIYGRYFSDEPIEKQTMTTGTSRHIREPHFGWGYMIGKGGFGYGFVF